MVVVLGLGPIIIYEDVAQGTLWGAPNQGAALPCVTDQEAKFPYGLLLTS